MADTPLFHSVLCPVDFSDHSRRALAYAALLTQRMKGHLSVIFVEDPLLIAAAAVAYDEKALMEKGRKQLRQLVERTIAPYGLRIADVTIDVAVGRPHDEIAWTADKLGCDIIVLGAHGRSGAPFIILFGLPAARKERRSAAKKPDQNGPADAMRRAPAFGPQAPTSCRLSDLLRQSAASSMPPPITGTACFWPR